MSKIVNGVFVALFFNTGILLLLTNANVSDVSNWLSGVFSGRYYDYSPQWYGSVGSVLVSTMYLNAFMPPVYELMANATVWLYQMLDNGWKCCMKGCIGSTVAFPSECRFSSMDSSLWFSGSGYLCRSSSRVIPRLWNSRLAWTAATMSSFSLAMRSRALISKYSLFWRLASSM